MCLDDRSRIVSYALCWNCSSESNFSRANPRLSVKGCIGVLPKHHRTLLGLSTAWRKGRFSLGANFSAIVAGSSDREHSGHVTFGIAF